MTLLLLLACSDAPLDTAAVVEDEGDCGDWTSVGQPFTRAYCSSCHSPLVTRRFGAPVEVDLFTLEQVQAHAQRSAVRIAEGTMPPSGGPSPTELDRVARWFACGAPGVEGPVVESGTLLDANLAGIGNVQVVVTDSFPEGFTVIHDAQMGRVLTEEILAFGGEAWLVSWEDDDRRVEYEPPLPIWGEPGTVESEALVEEDGGSWTEVQTWTFTVEAGQTDGRDLDGDALTALLVEAGGDEHSFRVSTEYGIVGRTLVDQSGTWWLQQNTGQLPENQGLGFPLREDQIWLEKAIWMAP